MVAFLTCGRGGGAEGQGGSDGLGGGAGEHDGAAGGEVGDVAGGGLALGAGDGGAEGGLVVPLEHGDQVVVGLAAVGAGGRVRHRVAAQPGHLRGERDVHLVVVLVERGRVVGVVVEHGELVHGHLSGSGPAGDGARGLRVHA